MPIKLELSRSDNVISLRSIRPPREGWDNSFRLMADKEDDRLLDADLLNGTCWDDEEWGC